MMSGCGCSSEQASSLERKTLFVLLAINGIMFFIEITLGLYAESTGLIADSLDMLADAFVYGLSLYAVGHSLQRQVSAARVSGYLQILLGFGVLIEVVRRFILGSEPLSEFMIFVGLLALVANIICLMLIAKHRQGGVHMRASWIFSTNDVIANLGVIVSGLIVLWSGSPYPDLVIGYIISMIVIKGGFRILREARESVPK